MPYVRCPECVLRFYSAAQRDSCPRCDTELWVKADGGPRAVYSEHVREAQQAARMGTWEWDVEGDRVLWSPELYRLYGHDPDERVASYEGFLERLHPADRLRVSTVIEHAVRDRHRFVIIHRIVRPDGERILEGRGHYAPARPGVPARLVGTAVDITDDPDSRDRLNRDAAAQAASGLEAGRPAKPRQRPLRTRLGDV